MRGGRVACASAAIGVLVWCGSVAEAGDVDPPVGPVTGTMKTLEEVEPRIPIGAQTTPGDADSVFRIAQPGSYYLTGDVVSSGVAGERGIEIAASGVSIDLMGFEVVGAVGSGDGIVSDGPIERVRLVNGMVRDWGGSGVHLWDVTECVAEGVVATRNGNAGIWVGNNSVVRGCVARENQGNNDGDGIGAGFGVVVSDCVSESNANSGIACIAGSITGCAARLNGLTGISGSGGVISDCSSRDNTGDGFGTTSGVIRSCVSRTNGGDGFWASDSSTIAQCTALSNTGNGIHVRHGCRIVENHCRGNGPGAADAAGILVEEDDCRIEANNVINNDRGIDVDMGGSIVVGNTARGNTTNYDIVAGNAVGQIVNVAGATITFSNPWANLEY